MAKKTIIQEFIEFINRGNVTDLAVGVIIGGAFTTLVNSFVTNIITPVISFLAGGTPGMPGLTVALGGQTVNFSSFIGDVVSFLITAAAVFAIIKALNKLNDIKRAAAAKVGIAKAKDKAPEPRRCPYCREEIAADATRCPHCTSPLEGYRNALD